MTGFALVEPPERSPADLATELCQEILDEAVADVAAIKSGERPKRPSYRSTEYDEAYAQGRKDTARTIYLTLTGKHAEGTSDDPSPGADA